MKIGKIFAKSLKFIKGLIKSVTIFATKRFVFSSVPKDKKNNAMIFSEPRQETASSLTNTRENKMKIINHTVSYYNQYYDVSDLPETIKDERTRTCNITCIAMITGEKPDDVLANMFNIHGRNDKFQWEENLILYLKEYGFSCEPVTKLAYPSARSVTDDELKKMRDEIIDGRIIFYHKLGHYQIMVGFENIDNNITYIFNDPAGDRRLAKDSRDKMSGFEVGYSSRMVKIEKIYGRCWSVVI